MRSTPKDYHHRDFDPVSLARSKSATRISVCIPARNEASTIGEIVGSIVSNLTITGGGVALVDELLVIDDGSTDDTARVASEAGAKVVSLSSPSGGKGQAMSHAVGESNGEIVVFLDGDVLDFSPRFVTGLVGPLLADDSLALIKGCYNRSLNGQAGEGGRVTELLARPVIDLLYPDLSFVRQPLAGETAVLRSVLQKVSLAADYGVEMALLIDVFEGWGAQAIAQVDLESRIHRNRPLSELRPQATEVLRVALSRAGISIHEADTGWLAGLSKSIDPAPVGAQGPREHPVLATCSDDHRRAQ